MANTSFKDKAIKFLYECRRVLKVTKKPNKKEFLNIAKISAVGLLLIGLIGFVLQTLKQLLF